MPQPTLHTLSSQAEKAYRAGNYAEAAALYQNAVQYCTEAGDAVNAAEMSNNRSVALLQSGDAQSALDAAQGTDAVFARAGDLRRQGIALGNQAAALEAMDQLDEALNHYWQCADLLKQAGEKEYRALVLKSISSLQVRTGRQLEAVATMESALENQSKLSLQERFLKGLLRIPLQMINRGK